MKNYDSKPDRLLALLHDGYRDTEPAMAFCAGFQLKKWRCESFADHLMGWIADFALKEEELSVTHGNMYVRLKQAAARVYTSKKYEKRGEVGEIALHAVCRDFFGTIPIAPRVFYLTSSNDVVKSFDMVHVRYISDDGVELWLGESKFYEDPNEAIKEAISSVKSHIDQGFLEHEKLLLGPQLSSNLAHHDKIHKLLSSETSLDDLFDAAVFPIFIMAQSAAAIKSEKHCPQYSSEVEAELIWLNERIRRSKLRQQIQILLIYLPLASKADLAKAFDDRLKAFSI